MRLSKPLWPSLLCAAGLFLAEPARASAPIPGGDTDRAEQTRRLQDATVEKLLQQMNRACATLTFSRAAMPRPSCPAKMESVARLKDRVLPAMEKQVIAEVRGATSKGRHPRDDRAQIMIDVMGRIGTPVAVGTLIHLISMKDVQQAPWAVYSIHEALQGATKTKFEVVDVSSQQSRDALVKKWLDYWEGHQPKQA